MLKRKNVVADSSFYICISDEIGHYEDLLFFIKTYLFHIGVRLLKEIKSIKLVAQKTFTEYMAIEEYDSFQLILPFFGRSIEHINDKEYEAIGLAYHCPT